MHRLPPHIRRRMKMFGILLPLIIVVVICVGYLIAGHYYNKADEAIGNIDRKADIMPSTTPSARPTPTSTPSKTVSTEPINVLLMGSDIRDGEKSGRSDTIMVAHIPADRKSIELVSIPRDMYVDIPGHDKQKINAAYSLGGDSLTAQTVQDFMGIDIDHVAIIDFKGFVNMVDTLGGVDIDNPFEGCDSNQRVCWKRGPQTLDKEKALQYVRWRHGLPNGDINRSQNQQRVVKAIIEKVINEGAISNPNMLIDMMNDLSEYITVDDQLTNSEIRKIAMSMRVTSSGDIKTITAPVAGFETVPKYGDVDVVDEKKMNELRQAFAEDDVKSYYEKHKDDNVAGVETNPQPRTSESSKPLDGVGEDNATKGFDNYREK